MNRLHIKNAPFSASFFAGLPKNYFIFLRIKAGLPAEIYLYDFSVITRHKAQSEISALFHLLADEGGDIPFLILINGTDLPAKKRLLWRLSLRGFLFSGFCFYFQFLFPERLLAKTSGNDSDFDFIFL